MVLIWRWRGVWQGSVQSSGVEDGDQHQRRVKSYANEDTKKRDSGLSWKMIKHIQKQSGNTCESMKILQFGVLQKSIWASVFWVLWTSLPLAWHWSHMDASMKKPHNCMRIISSYIHFQCRNTTAIPNEENPQVLFPTKPSDKSVDYTSNGV
jgi:hypothetical protein